MKVGDIKRKLLIVLSGSALAQLIHLLFTPILTRLYTPEQFGELALLISLIGLSTAFATGKFDLAIVMASEKEKVALDRGINKISLIFSFILLAVSVLFFYNKNTTYSSLIFFLSITSFFRAKYLSRRAVLNSHGKYKEIATGRVVENTSNGFSAVILSFLELGSIGLMISKTLSFLLPSIYYQSKTHKYLMGEPDLKTKDVFSKYKSFPKYSIFTELLTQLNLNFTIFGFAYFYGEEVVGHLSMTTRVLSLPINFIGLAFLDVFREKATADYLKHGSCRSIFKKFFYALSLMALLGYALVALFGEEIFTIVLGGKWSLAGKYASIAILLYSVRLVSSPLGYTFHLAQKQMQEMFFKALILILSLATLAPAYFWGVDATQTLTNYTLSISLAYALYILAAYKYSKGAI